MSQNVTTKEMETALEKLAEQMGMSIKEYVEGVLSGTRKPDISTAKDKFKQGLSTGQSS